MLFGDALLLGAAYALPRIATISGSLTDVNLKTWLDANTSYDTNVDFQTFDITISATIGASSTSATSLTISGFPSNTTINIIGGGCSIFGYGGAGGAHGTAVHPDGFNGSAGGNAMSIDQDVTFTGTGIIGGGGGGGGGSAIRFFQDGDDNYGGDGAGSQNSGVPQPGGPRAVSCKLYEGDYYYTNNGGTGGSLGASGTSGLYWCLSGAGCTTCTPRQSGGSGGAAGKAINTNGNTVTNNSSITFYGSIS